MRNMLLTTTVHSPFLKKECLCSEIVNSVDKRCAWIFMEVCTEAKSVLHLRDAPATRGDEL